MVAGVDRRDVGVASCNPPRTCGGRSSCADRRYAAANEANIIRSTGKCLLFNQFSPHKNQGRREGKRRTNGKRENRDLPSPL